MKAKPTKTTNKLHLTDLSASRFEDLCLALLYPMRPWLDFRHYGRKGADGGVDIYATELLENSKTREWTVQCRRYSTATKSVLRKAVLDVLSKRKKPPDVLLVVVACDVRADAHEYFIEFASSKGVGQPMIWTQSFIEAKLYNERADLLYAYFNVSLIAQARSRETSVRRNIALKRRMRAELVRKDADTREILRRPSAQFVDSQVIIRSIDDSSYPCVDSSKTGISSWFRVNLHDFYHNGIQVTGASSIARGAVDSSWNWLLLMPGEQPPEGFQEEDLRMLMCIPYRNIVDFDRDGDEYHSETHFFCTFSDSGTPYEETRYGVLTDDRRLKTLDPDRQVKRKRKIVKVG